MRKTIIKNYRHNTKLAEGKFAESDFNFKLKGEGGRTDVGDMSPQRRQLIISDAKERLRKLEAKFPWLKDGKKEEVKEEKNVLEKVSENKKKAKK